MRIRYWGFDLFVLLLMAGLFPAPADAELDVVQAEMVAGDTLPMRWDNIEGAPWYVTGEAPAYSTQEDMHLVELNAGDMVTVRLPVYEMLRIYRPDGTLLPTDVQVSLSNGTGLYARWQPQRSHDGHSLLVAPQASDSMLVRIQVPANGQTRRLALFISRHESLGKIAPYRGVVSLEGETVGIRRADQRGSRTFWVIKANQPVTVRLRGPARYVLENRFQYGAQETALNQNYQVEVHMDGRLLRLMEFESSIDSTRQVYVGNRYFPGGSERAVGQLQAGYLEIPDGEHEIRLVSNANLYARLLEQEDPDYLFPDWNAPVPDAGQIRRKLSAEAPTSAWQLKAEDIRQRLAQASPAEMEIMARRIMQDNHYRDGGLVGAMLMRQYAARHPEYPRARVIADLMFARHTFYRDLFPSPAPESLQKEFFWFVPRHLNNPSDSLAGQVIEAQHLRASLFSVSGAYFMSLPRAVHAPEQALQFSVPRRSAPSVLRVSTGVAGRGAEQHFWLQFDDRPAIAMRVAAGVPELDADQFAPSRAEAAFRRLSEQFGEQDATTLGGAYGSYRMPARLVDVASLELPLPAGVQRIRIWQDGHSQLSVALQYRAASRFKMSEASYLSALQRAGREQALQWLTASVRQQFDGSDSVPQAAGLHYAVQVGSYRESKYAREQQQALQRAGYMPRIRRANGLLYVMTEAYATEGEARQAARLLRAKGFADAYVISERVRKTDAMRQAKMDGPFGLPEQAQAELQNEWQSLLRLMLTQNRTFNIPEGASRQALNAGKRLPETTVQRLVREAEAAEAKQAWLDALEKWSVVAGGARDDIYRKAQMHRIDALQHLGEVILARKMLQALFLYAEDAQMRRQAFRRLLDDAGRTGKLRAMLPLLVVATIRDGTAEMYASFASLLAGVGEDRMALTLGLLLPEAQVPWQAMAGAAYRQGRDRTLTMAMQHLPAAQRMLWAGYRQQREGEFSAAVVSWKQAGEQGRLLADRLQQGLQIREQLLAADQHRREKGMQAWWQWWNADPGPWQWRESPAMIVRSEGQEIIENVERDLIFYGARASQEHPVTLLVPGPLDVRVEIRPLHAADSHDVINGWLNMREQGLLRPLPIVNNAPEYALRVQGKSLVAGRGVHAVYSFGPGLHEVQVSAGNIPVVVRVFARRSAIPLTVLPPLSAETMAAVLDGTLARQRHPAVPLDIASLQQKLAALAGQSESAAQAAQRREAELLSAGRIDEALAIPVGKEDADILRRMRMLLWIKENYPARAQQVLTRGEALFDQHPMVPGLSTLHARLTADSIWASQKMMENSAGMQVVTRQGWQPESIRQRVRKALLPPLAKDEQVIPGFRRFRVVLNNVQPARLYLDLTAHGVPFSDPLPMQVTYQLDDNPVHVVRLSAEHPRRTLALDVPEGRHAVVVGIRNPIADQFLRMRISERRGGKYKPIVMTYEQTYYVATPDEPVVLNVRGPMWMRIDRRVHGQSHVSYRQIGGGWHKLIYRPKAGEVAYRFSGRVVAKGVTTRSPAARPGVEMVTLHPVPEALVQVPDDLQPAETIHLHDGFELGDQEDGTWSFGASYNRRLNASEDRQQFAPVSGFTQLDVWHRYDDEPDNRYFRTHLLGRFREHGDTVLGLTERAYFNAPEWPVTLRLDGSLYAEHFSGLNPAVSTGVNSTEWSATLQGTVLRKEYINPKWYHIPSLTGFVRHVSMTGTPTALRGSTLVTPPAGLIGRIDTDVYTPYKQVHRYGIGVSETLGYQPWLDTLLRASVGWRSNENLLKTDHVGILLRWDQRLGDAQLNLGYQFTHYYADDYRLSSANTKSIRAELLWDVWQDDQTRWELGGVLRHYLSRPKENVGLIGLTVHFGEGRMYRDFQPGELDIPEFLPLRQRRIPQSVNNFVGAGQP